MDENNESTPSNRELGSPGYTTDTPEYPGRDSEGLLGQEVATREELDQGDEGDRLDLKRFLEPREAAEAAAALFGVARTTLARLLVVRGAREILGRSPDSRV